MPKQSKPTALPIKDGNSEHKQMILKLPPQQHEWVKKVAEETNQTQPHVINYLLEQITKQPPEDYIEEIGKIYKEKQRQELLQKQQAIKEQLARLETELN